MGLGIVRQAAILGRLKSRGRGRATVNGSAVPFHPLADPAEAVQGAIIERAAPGRPDIEQQIAPAAHHADQHLHELLHAFPTRLVAVIAPRSRKGLARFPQHALALVRHPLAGHNLFGRAVIPSAFHVVQIQAVIDHDARLQRTRHFHQFHAVPIVSALAIKPLGPAPCAGRIAEVVKHHIHFAVFGQQLAHLPVQIRRVLGLIARFVQRVLVRVISQGVNRVDPKLRVVPVDQ